MVTKRNIYLLGAFAMKMASKHHQGVARKFLNQFFFLIFLFYLKYFLPFQELRRVAFEIDVIGGVDASSKRQMGGYAKDYKKLGFKYDINPAQDFTETPPGMLALDCMIYFARNHPEAYTKVTF